MRSTGPFHELRRHFLEGFFRPAFLGEHGADALRRLLITLASLTAMLGLFLPYPLLKKYWYLAGLDTGGPYHEALVADQTLVIGVPMIIVGLVMTLVAPSLYVDDADFLVLTPLPVPSTTVFAAKLVAVVTFVGLFVLAANTVGNLWFPTISGGRWAAHSWLARTGAHTVASILATSFVALAIAAAQGLTVTLLPRRLATRASTTLQAMMLCALTAAIPLLLRMPGRLEMQPWMAFAPPCWFVGVSHVVLGDRDPGFVRLAIVAAVAYGVVLAGVIASYAAVYVLYGRSGEPTIPPQLAKLPPVSAPNWMARRMGRATLAGFDFIRATAIRSRLNVLVLAGAIAIGAGLVVDTLLIDSVGWRYRIALPSREVTYRAIAPSLMLALTTLVGLRAMFLLPVAREANWIFRLIDTQPARIGLLVSVEVWFAAACVAAPLIIGLPIQLGTLGIARTALSTPLILLAALVMVEIVLSRWRRVPFTCSYIPGKQHVAKVLMVAGLAYWLFVYLTGHIIGWAILRPSRWLMVLGLLLTAWAALRRHRLAWLGQTTFEFEDEMPDAIRSLGLSS